MIQFFHDVNLTVPNTIGSPKRFVTPEKGITGKTSVMYLADTYQVQLTAAVDVGTSTLYVDDTSEFLDSGTGYVISGDNTYTIQYTGKTSGTLTGVSGIIAPLLLGDVVKPWKVYITRGNITIAPSGADLATIRLSIGINPGQYNYPGTTAIFNQVSYDNIQNSAIPVYLSVDCPAGSIQEFNNWSMITSGLYIRDKSDSSSIGLAEVGHSIVGYFYLNRKNQALSTTMRLLPANRALNVDLPGFILGSYRWRDSTTQNSQVLAKTSWDPDLAKIGTEKFTSGIARDNDLALVDLENQDNSIYCRIDKGFYFARTDRFYLPSQPVIEFLNASNTEFYPQSKPNVVEPIFVGVWQLDSNGFYNKYIDYRYRASGTFTTTDTYQYTYSFANNRLDINTALPQVTVFLGTVSGMNIDYFDMPIYPVDSIESVYVGRTLGAPNVYAPNFSFDREQGTISIPSIAGTFTDEPLYAVCNPAVAVVYNSGTDPSRLIDEVDLNPAYSGLSSGYLYLQHRRRKPSSLLLSCDKPIIPIPATNASIVGLVAYGPIYFDGDYALLTVQAIGSMNDEPIAGAILQPVVGADWAGTLNYLDPTSTVVTVITGADGKANLLYKPQEDYGYTIPLTTSSNSNAGVTTTHQTNDTIVLPIPIGIDRVYSAQEGWLVRVYTVLTGDPTYGLVGADASKGELSYMTTGTPGTIGYKTNGEKVLIAQGQTPILPIDALDENGHSRNSSNFSGNVVQLVYANSLPSGSTIGAYFITLAQRVSIQMEVANTNIISNTILLEMGFVDHLSSPWLIINDAIQGRLNQYRLGR